MKMIIQKLLIAGLVLASAHTYASAISTTSSSKAQVNAAAARPTQKKLTWKQKISRKLGQAKNFIANNAVALGVVGYLLYLRVNAITTEIEQRRRDLDLQHDAFFLGALNMAPGLLPPQDSQRIVELYTQAGARERNLYWPMVHGAFHSNTPQGNDLREAIYRDARFYPAITREQFQQAQNRIRVFNIAVRRNGINRDVINHLLVPELANDIATIGFWHLHNNPAQIARMPNHIRNQFIHLMAVRHLNDLENLIAQEPPHLGFVNNRVNDYHLPALEEVHLIMAQRINDYIIQPAPDGAQQSAGQGI